ncbi:MAG: DinB family protein [Chloroflexota bacterium]
MPSPRLEEIIGRLEKGGRKTNEIFGKLTPEQWQRVVYDDPLVWTARDLLAHFVSAEESLLQLAQDVAANGAGLPEDFDYDAFNAQEQTRLRDCSPEFLLTALNAARQKTLDWTRTLDDAQLDRVGQHPALGEVTLETMLVSIYGHQLFHMREAQTKLG